MVSIFKRKEVEHGGFVTEEDARQELKNQAKREYQVILEAERERVRQEQDAIRTKKMMEKAAKKAHYESLPTAVKVAVNVRKVGRTIKKINEAVAEIKEGAREAFDTGQSARRGAPTGASVQTQPYAPKAQLSEDLSKIAERMFDPDAVFGSGIRQKSSVVKTSGRKTRDEVIEDFKTRITQIPYQPYSYKAMLIADIAKNRLLNGVDKVNLVKLAEREGRKPKSKTSAMPSDAPRRQQRDSGYDVMQDNEEYMRRFSQW